MTTATKTPLDLAKIYAARAVADLGLRRMPVLVRDLRTAFSIADGCAKPQRVMLGLGEYHWVVCPADAAKLERAGVEYAERPRDDADLRRAIGIALAADTDEEFEQAARAYFRTVVGRDPTDAEAAALTAR